MSNGENGTSCEGGDITNCNARLHSTEQIEYGNSNINQSNKYLAG